MVNCVWKLNMVATVILVVLLNNSMDWTGEVDPVPGCPVTLNTASVAPHGTGRGTKSTIGLPEIETGTSAEF